MFNKKNIYYHGSTEKALTHLKCAYAAEENPFGPAIYLTCDSNVAECYSRSGGAIYRVRLFGDSELTINLDATVEQQTDKAIDAIRRLSTIIHRRSEFCDKYAEFRQQK